jgi:hypothetical protein
MVGTPRSKGCSICRKRKIKCDRKLPHCHNCQVSGWSCDGYEKKWKFIREESQISERYKKRQHLFEEHQADLIPYLRDRRNVLQEIDQLEEEYSGLGWMFRVAISRLPRSQSDQLATVFSYILNDTESQAILPLRSLGSYFLFVPSRLGRNPSLDDTISCLCAIYTDMRTGTPQGSPNVLKLYCKCLKSLYECLQDAKTRLEPETVCSSLILQICELMISSDNGRWNNLFQGSQTLFQELGPRRFNEPFERAMLESARTIFVTQNMNSREDCLLSDSEWQRLSQIPDSSFQVHKSEAILLKSNIGDLFLDVSKLLREGESLWSDGKIQGFGNSLIHTRLQTFHSAVTSLYARLELCYENQLRPLIPIQNYTHPHLPTNYPDILLARLECGITAALAKLQQLSNQVALMDGLVEVHIFDRKVALERIQISRSALHYVKLMFPMSAKPLEFGLRQLWSRGGFDLQHELSEE